MLCVSHNPRRNEKKLLTLKIILNVLKKNNAIFNPNCMKAKAKSNLLKLTSIYIPICLYVKSIMDQPYTILWIF